MLTYSDASIDFHFVTQYTQDTQFLYFGIYIYTIRPYSTTTSLLITILTLYHFHITFRYLSLEGYVEEAAPVSLLLLSVHRYNEHLLTANRFT